MKATWHVLLAGILLTCAAAHVLSQTGQLSPEQARAKVRSMANVSDSELPPAKAHNVAGRLKYMVKLGNGDVYSVDATTGEVWVYYGSNVSNLRTTEEIRAARLTLTALERVARDLLRDRYHGAPATSMVLQPPHFDGTCDTFSFVEVLPENGAFTENHCDIRLGADTGRIVSYTDHIEAIPAAARRKPRVPENQVIPIATWATHMLDPLAAENLHLVYARGTLFWGVRIRGVLPSGMVGSYHVDIDADTGHALRIGTYMLAGYPQPPRGGVMLARSILVRSVGPLTVHGRIYVSKRVLSALGGSVTLKGNQATVVAERNVVIRASDILTRGGDLFVPVATIARAFPTTVLVVDNNPKRHTVNIICDVGSAAMWHGEHGEPWQQPSSDRSLVVRQNATRLGIVATQAELQRLLPKKPAIVSQADHQRSGVSRLIAASGAVAICLAAGIVWQRHRMGIF